MLCSLPMHQSIVVYRNKQVISYTPTKSNPTAPDHKILEANSRVHFLRWFVHEFFLSIKRWYRLLCGTLHHPVETTSQLHQYLEFLAKKIHWSLLFVLCLFCSLSTLPFHGKTYSSNFHFSHNISRRTYHLTMLLQPHVAYYLPQEQKYHRRYVFCDENALQPRFLELLITEINEIHSNIPISVSK